MTSQRICSSGKPHEITTTQNQTSTVLIYKRHPAQPIETNLNQNRRNKIHKKMHNKIEKKNYTGTARCWRILLQILKLLQNSLRRHREKPNNRSKPQLGSDQNAKHEQIQNTRRLRNNPIINK